jgi:hypothetical protein
MYFNAMFILFVNNCQFKRFLADKFSKNIKNNRILTKSEFIDSIYTDLVGFE